MEISRREAMPVYLIDQSELGITERPRHILMTAAGDGTGASNFIGNFTGLINQVFTIGGKEFV